MTGQEDQPTEDIVDAIDHMVEDFIDRRSQLSEIWLEDICERMKIRRKALAKDAGLDASYDVGSNCKKSSRTAAEIAAILWQLKNQEEASSSNGSSPTVQSGASGLSNLARIALLGSAIAGSGGLAAIGGSSLLQLFGGNGDSAVRTVVETVVQDKTAELQIVPPDSDQNETVE